MLVPSDTTYGLLADATHELAIQTLIALKKRPHGKPISVFVSGFEMMSEYVDTQKLTTEARSLLPGPFTLVLPALHRTSPLLEAEDGTLGVRFIGGMRHHDTYQTRIAHAYDRSDSAMGDKVTALVAHYGKPLTATSANISGRGVCYSPQAFFNQLSTIKRKYITGIIDAGELPHRPPSTVIHLGGHAPQILRASDQNYLHHKTHVTHDESETADIAHMVLAIVRNHVGKRPVVVLLDGELGSGKTTWVKAFATLWGVGGIVSPTYTYECEYDITRHHSLQKLRHYDLYNITHHEDMAKLNIPGHLTPHTIVCIEWPGQLNEAVRSELARIAYLIRLEFRYIGETSREVRVWWN